MPLLDELKYISNKYSALKVHWVSSVNIFKFEGTVYKLFKKLNNMFLSYLAFEW